MSGRVVVSFSGSAGTDTNEIEEIEDFWTWRTVAASDDKFELPASEAGSGSATDDEGQDLKLYIIYEGLTNDNMFTADAIAAMDTFERALLELEEGWDKHCTNATSLLDPSDTRCASPQTVLRYLYTNDALEEQQCRAGFCHALRLGLSVAYCDTAGTWGVFPCTSTVYDWRDGTLAPAADWVSLLSTRVCANTNMATTQTLLLASAATCTATSLSSRYVRSLYQVHSPSNETCSIMSCEFTEDNGAWVDALVRVLQDQRKAVSATGLMDTRVATSGVVNVWWVDAANWTMFDQNQMLMMADLFLAIFSFVLITVILMLNTGSIVLTAAGLFEIVLSFPLAMFLWMLVGQTRLTTFEVLGIFLILCIGADDIFVFTDTWKESAVMPPSISGSLQTRFTWTYGRAASAMLTTTITTAFCLMLNAISPFPMVKTFGLFNMFVVICDYALVITWYACVTVCLTQLNQRACPPGGNWEFSCCCPGGKREVKERRVTAWFRDKLAPCLHRLRWPCIALTISFLCGGIAINSAMFADGELKFFSDSHPAGRIGVIQSDEFGDPDNNKLQTIVMYGLASPPVAFPTSINLFQSMEPGYADRFELRHASAAFGPAQQQQLVADCDAFRANAEICQDGEGYCLLNELKAVAGSAFPYADEAALRAALEDFYASAAYATLKATYQNYDYWTGFLTDGEAEIKAIWNTFNNTMPTSIDFVASDIRSYYDPWRKAADEQCGSAAPCVISDVGYYNLLGLTDGLVQSAMQNVYIALIVSYLVLVLVTRNLWAPLLAVLSIGATVTWVLAAVFAVGYKFEALAALLLVMCVGLSVDYAVHIVHFYNEASGNRYEKAQAAVHGVGVSVCGGAVTTIGAAIPLLAAQHVVFFTEMGVFILFTALFGVLFSFLLLVPLLMTVGPQGEQGDLAPIWRRLRGRGSGEKRASAKTVVPEAQPMAAEPKTQVAGDRDVEA